MINALGFYPGPEVIKLFHAQLSIKFIVLINVKMPTIQFISMINTRTKIVLLADLSFSAELIIEKFYNLGT